MFKYFALVTHAVLHTAYQVYINYDLLLVVSVAMHLMCFVNPPHCYVGHCAFQNTKQEADEQRGIVQRRKYEMCLECGLKKFVRMNHCYRCRTCVHKYDHHCILLGFCIGETNQRFYIVFLWLYMYSCWRQSVGYFSRIPNHLAVDEFGYEHTDWPYVAMAILIIFCSLVALVTTYLAVLHTYYALCNQTTYESRKAAAIWYLRDWHGRSSPFDRGVVSNLKTIFVEAGRGSPIEWQQPRSAHEAV